MKKERKKIVIENIKDISSKELLSESEQYDPKNYKPSYISDIFKAKARKYNNYQETECTKGRKCRNCVRWRFSFPYTCNDCDIFGLLGKAFNNKAETCLNYSEDPKCEVD